MENNRDHNIKHIGFITPEYPHAQIKQAAGIGTSVKNLVSSLVDQGIKVTVFVYQQELNSIEFDEGVELHLLQKKIYLAFGWYFHRKYINSYINKIVEKKNIEILEAPDWTGITAFMKFKIPLVIRLHGTDAYFCKLENRPQKKKNYLFEKMALQKASSLVAPTRYAGEISRTIFNLNSKSIHTIFNSIQAEKFVNDNSEVFDQNKIVYIGTLIRKKGVLELSKIFNELIKIKPEATLVLIGSDSKDIETGSTSTYELMIQEFSEAAIKRVNYLGKVSYDEVKQHMKHAHVCVFPSLAETFGMVTVEAMAMQKAVISSKYGWSKEIIDNNINGCLVDPKNHQLFATNINKLLSDKTICQKYGINAREKVLNTFDTKIVVLQNINLYNSLL